MQVSCQDQHIAFWTIPQFLESEDPGLVSDIHSSPLLAPHIGQLAISHDSAPSLSTYFNTGQVVDVGSWSSWVKTPISCGPQHYSERVSLKICIFLPLICRCAYGTPVIHCCYIWCFCPLPLFHHTLLSDVPRMYINSIVLFHLSCTHIRHQP